MLLSGATGFLGSHLAEHLSLNGYQVLALVRNSSDLSRCKEFINDNLVFINTDVVNYKESIAKYRPTFFIHTAWQGVSLEGRNDQNLQEKNITLTKNLLLLVKELGIKKIIALGSQAEYGNFTGRIKEEVECNPFTPYGSAKIAALNMLRSFCELNAINWFWIRIFSIYGIREKKEWLIPSLIKSILNDKPLDLTGGEQRYDYLYAKDFCSAIVKVLETDSESGIFNLSSNSSMQLKVLVEKIKKIANPNAVLNFGALPYRPDQLMHMEGDSTKFNQRFDFHITSSLDDNLKQIVNYYKAKK